MREGLYSPAMTRRAGREWEEARPTSVRPAAPPLSAITFLPVGPVFFLFVSRNVPRKGAVIDQIVGETSPSLSDLHVMTWLLPPPCSFHGGRQTRRRVGLVRKTEFHLWELWVSCGWADMAWWSANPASLISFFPSAKRRHREILTQGNVRPWFDQTGMITSLPRVTRLMSSTTRLRHEPQRCGSEHVN